MTEPAATGSAGIPFGPAEKRELHIRQVWADNLNAEFHTMQYAALYFPYISMDTEFPGVVIKPFSTKEHYQLTAEEQYAAIKANVDELHLIQLGLAFAASPNSPPAFAFQINLREFDKRVHPHNKDSIELLTKHGINFAAHRSHGVDARVLGKLLVSSGLFRPKRGPITWVTFSAGYDLAYVVKLLTGSELPETLQEFLNLVHHFFGDNLYDVKHMLGCCSMIRGRSLEKASVELGVVRDAGMSHQAASDSAVTWDTFRGIRDVHFSERAMQGFVGMVHNLGPLPHRRLYQPQLQLQRRDGSGVRITAPPSPLRSSEEEERGAISGERSGGEMADHDPELEAIRQRRMQELMGQHGAGAANPQNAGQEKAQEEAKQEAEERRKMLLAQILSPESRERLSRIALVKPDKARGVEDDLLEAGLTGGISEKVSEERLTSLLEQINIHTSKQTSDDSEASQRP